MKQQPILITGIERSGSTIIAKIIKQAGVYTGECTNMLENKSVKELMDDYYRYIGADVTGQFPLPYVNAIDLGHMDDWNKRVLNKLGLKNEDLFLYKSSRIAQTWKLWNLGFPNAKWIIVRRRTGDIIQSCVKTGYMRAFKDVVKQKCVGANNEQEGWLWWVKQQEERVQDILKKCNCFTVWPERMVDGDFEQIKEMFVFLDLEWNDSIIEFVKPMLWKSILKKKGE